MTIKYALSIFDDLHATARKQLVDNAEFQCQRVNGHWEPARAPAEFPLTGDFIKGFCSVSLGELEAILEKARVECVALSGSCAVSDRLLSQTEGATAASLVDDEFEHLNLQLKTLVTRSLQHLSGGRGRSLQRIDTHTFIHDALFIEACNFCDEVDRSRNFIGFMMTDPCGYLDELNNRRWDAANLAFSEDIIEGRLFKADPWRQIGDAWTREFQVENASGDKNCGIVSVHFRRLHSVPERIRVRLANPETKHETGIELEIS